MIERPVALAIARRRLDRPPHIKPCPLDGGDDIEALRDADSDRTRQRTAGAVRMTRLDLRRAPLARRAAVAEHVEKSREEIGFELADVLYWVLLMSHDLGIDIASSFESKMTRNEEKYPVEKARGRTTKYNQL